MEWDDDVGLWILFEKGSLRDCIFGGNDESVMMEKFVYEFCFRKDWDQKFEKEKKKKEKNLDDTWMYIDRNKNTYQVCRIYYFDDF